MSEPVQERVLVYDRIDANRRKTGLLMFVFVLSLAAFFVAVGVLLTYLADIPEEDRVELSVRLSVAAAFLAAGLGVMMYLFAPLTVLAASGGREVSREEEPELYRVVENLCIGAGLPMLKVHLVYDGAPNAFATGRDPGSAHVAVTTGLLEKLEKRELEAVIAHELSHIGNYDIRLMTVLAVAIGLVALVSDLLLRFTWYGAGGRRSNRGKGEGALGAIILVAAIVFIVVAPIAAGIIRLAVSRQREYLADSSGALLCRNPAALADALEKIARDPEPLETANKATAHLYIADPLKGHESPLNNLFATHPPIEQRIALLRAMA